MKVRYIIALVFIAAAMVAVFSIYGKTSTYADFQYCTEHPGKEVHIVGMQVKDSATYYNPQENPNYFSFYIKDEKGIQRKVELHNTKPQDFEKAERVVVICNMEGEIFKASSMLMKCPSKYNKTQI